MASKIYSIDVALETTMLLKHVIHLQSCKSGFPKVGFVNPWWFVRELQGVRGLVHGRPTSVSH